MTSNKIHRLLLESTMKNKCSEHCLSTLCPKDVYIGLATNIWFEAFLYEQWQQQKNLFSFNMCTEFIYQVGFYQRDGGCISQGSLEKQN